MPLPDAEALCAELVTRLRPVVTAATAMVGIHTGGAWLAERLHRELGLTVPLGRLDISFYRDDYAKSGLHKSVKASQIPFEVDGRHILLVDDVLYTGRTVRAAMDAVVDFGRPRAIRLVVLVDRGHRELPIRPDFVGKNLPTSPTAQVHVHLAEADGADEVVLEEDAGTG
jgi:pyrimidine operon attenuation protein/uracil phosphoribosyltransferase